MTGHDTFRDGDALPDWLRDLPVSALAPAPGAVDDPLRDHGRLRAVAALRAHDPEWVQPLVADLLAQAAEGLQVPVALLNVVLTDALVVAGAHGLTGWLAEARAAAAEDSLCPTVVRTGKPWVLPDVPAGAGPQQGPPGGGDVRAYAGVPLRTADGHVVGALCALDTVSRPFTADQLGLLQELAERAVRLLADAAADA